MWTSNGKNGENVSRFGRICIYNEHPRVCKVPFSYEKIVDFIVVLSTKVDVLCNEWYVGVYKSFDRSTTFAIKGVIMMLLLIRVINVKHEL